MARYIEVDALITYANNQKDKTIDANDIARFPWADVRENVHAKWIKDGIPGLLCSNCGKHIIVERKYISFCPNCGAVMTIDKSFEDWIKKEG